MTNTLIVEVKDHVILTPIIWSVFNILQKLCKYKNMYLQKCKFIFI